MKTVEDLYNESPKYRAGWRRPQGYWLIQTEKYEVSAINFIRKESGKYMVRTLLEDVYRPGSAEVYSEDELPGFVFRDERGI